MILTYILRHRSPGTVMMRIALAATLAGLATLAVLVLVTR